MNTIENGTPVPANHFSCVIFDMDGTLTQTNDLIFASFNHVAGKYLGRSFSPPEIIALFGPPEEGALETLVGKEDAGPAMEDLCAFYESNHAEMAALHPDIHDLLSFLKRQDVTLGVFTGKGTRTVEITMRHFDLTKYFSVVMSGSDVEQHKPHPEGIQRILDACGVPPERALMVGDSMSDVRASRAAGVRMAGVLWDSYDAERMRAAELDYAFHRVSDMLAWFQSSYTFSLS